MRHLAKEATAALGPTDMLVNNAGIFLFAPTAQVDETTFDATMTTNVKGPFYLTATLAPHMAERGPGGLPTLLGLLRQRCTLPVMIGVQ